MPQKEVKAWETFLVQGNDFLMVKHQYTSFGFTLLNKRLNQLFAIEFALK